MTESALLQACQRGDTSTVKRLLRQGEVYVSLRMLRLSLSSEVLTLFMEYGQLVTSENRICNYEKLIACIDHDLDISNFILRFENSTVKQCQILHHLLRAHGQLCFSHTRNLLTRLAEKAYDGPTIKDLRYAITYAVCEKDAKQLISKVMKSMQRDWFLMFVKHFGLNINELLPFFPALGATKNISSAVCNDGLGNYTPNVLLAFLAEECHAYINAVDADHQTALIHACRDMYFPVGIVKDLVRYGADVNVVDGQGWTALDHAVRLAKRVAYKTYKSNCHKVVILLQVGAVLGPKTCYTDDDLRHIAWTVGGHDLVLKLEMRKKAKQRKNQKNHL